MTLAPCFGAHSAGVGYGRPASTAGLFVFSFLSGEEIEVCALGNPGIVATILDQFTALVAFKRAASVVIVVRINFVRVDWWWQIGFCLRHFFVIGFLFSHRSVSLWG